jgi:hypothetical protein
MPAFFTQFGTGVLVASADGHWLALETPSGIRLFPLSAPTPTPTPSGTPPSPTPTVTPSITPGGSLLIPSAIRRDLVFDYSGQNLYISNSTGTVRAFNLSTLSFGAVYELGGSLNGFDIARDNSFLVVAQNATGASQGTFHKVDLATGLITNINYTRSGETGAWDVAIGSNGLALVTTRNGGSGSVPLRQIDLVTNVITVRSDVPGFGGRVEQDTHIHRSADGTRLFFMESNTSSGPIFTYSAISNTFGPAVNTGTDLSNASGAVNRNGSLVALRPSLFNAPNLNVVHSFNGIDKGVAFDASSDILYGVNSTAGQIIAYSTETFAELFRLNIGENMPIGSPPFGTGVLVASADGHWLALETPSGIRLFPLAAIAPTPTPSATPTATPTPPPTPTPTPTPSPTPTPPASPTPTPTVAPAPTPTPTSSTLGNISTRLRVLSGDNALIGGLIATGSEGKKVIIRAIGPTLSDFGVPGALMDPTLELYQGSTLLFSNDDWRNSSQQAEVEASGFAPNKDAESAIIWTLTPGQNYTAIVRGKNNATGIGVVEAFDLDHAAASKLGNISTRGFVDVDDNVMIAGLIVGPGNGPSIRILARALGPTLSDFGVPGALADPTLDLVNASGTVVRSNNNWRDDPQQRAEIEAAGLAPIHDEEAALVETVAPGAYTAVVRGNNRSTGVGLVEAYNIP